MDSAERLRRQFHSGLHQPRVLLLHSPFHRHVVRRGIHLALGAVTGIERRTDTACLQPLLAERFELVVVIPIGKFLAVDAGQQLAFRTTQVSGESVEEELPSISLKFFAASSLFSPIPDRAQILS